MLHFFTNVSRGEHFHVNLAFIPADMDSIDATGQRRMSSAAASAGPTHQGSVTGLRRGSLTLGAMEQEAAAASAGKTNVAPSDERTSLKG